MLEAVTENIVQFGTVYHKFPGILTYEVCAQVLTQADLT